MRYFCRLIWYFAALGTLLCSCGGSHHGDRLVEAGEPEFFSIVERPQGGWTVVSVSPFDGSSDTLVVDKPMTNIIVMSTSHYGFLDALGRSDVISGISGPDYLWTEGLPRELRASEYGSSRQALTVRTPRSARPLPSLGEIVKTSLPSLSIDLGPSLLHDEGVHGPDLPDLPTDSERAGAASLDGETHATLGTVRGGTGASLCDASGGAERSEAVEPPELAAPARFQATVRPPRLGGNARVGVFASRSPFRPNPLGLSSVRLESIDYEAKDSDGRPIGPVINVLGADLMDGTPIYDIKPYVEYADSHPGARSGFVDTIAWEPLQVEFPVGAEETIPELDTLREVLSLDPRPSYQDDPSREYGMSFGGREVRFKVSGSLLTVISIK